MGRVSNPSVCVLAIGMLSLAARVNVFSDGDNYGFVANSSLAARVISGSVFMVRVWTWDLSAALEPLDLSLV